MATFNFPASPTVGQIYTPSAGISYTWTGTHWDRNAGPLVPAMPAGVYVPFAGTTAPAGTLLCDGRLILRADYPLLFAAIGVAYGAGDGSTTFGLPDLRGRVPFGRDDMGGAAANRITLAVAGFAATTVGAVGGDQNMQSHLHGVNITSAGESVGHTHVINFNSQNDNVDHTHGVVGATDTQGDHAHLYDRYSAQGANTQTVATANQARNPVATWTDTRGAHAHNISITSYGASARHLHHVYGTSDGNSVSHTHGVNGNTATAGAGGAGNVPPTIIANYIIFTGA